MGAYHIWMDVHLSFMQNNSNVLLPIFHQCLHKMIRKVHWLTNRSDQTIKNAMKCCTDGFFQMGPRRKHSVSEDHEQAHGHMCARCPKTNPTTFIYFLPRPDPINEDMLHYFPMDTAVPSKRLRYVRTPAFSSYKFYLQIKY